MNPRDEQINIRIIPDSKVHGANLGPLGAGTTQVGPLAP